MEKWRNPLGLATLCAGLMALTPSAANADNGWNDSNCCNFNSFEIGVDFLYWKPCVSDLEYVAIQDHKKKNDDFKFNMNSICTDWEPGVRAFIKVPSCTCDWDMEASYTYIETRNTDKKKFKNDDEDKSPINSHPNFDLKGTYKSAKGRWNAEYQEWEVLFVYNLHNTRCHKFSNFFGVAGINLNQNLNIFMDDSRSNKKQTLDTRWKGDYWGVGFRAGTHYEYNVSDCVTFFTRAHGSVLAGEPNKVRLAFTIVDKDIAPEEEVVFEKGDKVTVTFIDKNNNACQIVPGYHIGAGFSYNTDFCDTEWSLRIGYEFLHWFNLPRHRTLVGGQQDSIDDADAALSTSSASTGRALGFHGLMAGVSVAF